MSTPNDPVDLWLAEVQVWNPDTEAVETLTFANGKGYVTGPDRENLSVHASALDNAAWTKSRTTIGANADTAPDGTTTADRLIEDATATNSHRAYSASLITIVDGQNICISRYLRAGTRSWAFLGAIDNTEVVSARSYFDLATGAIGSNQLNSGATMVAKGVVPYPDGWSRCWVIVNMGAGVTGIRHYLGLATGDLTPSYSGDGASYISVWRAQTEIDGLSDSIDTGATAVARPNPDVIYKPRLLNAVDVKQDLFQSGTTFGRSRMSFGNVVLDNKDGALDYLVDWGFDGRTITIKRGTKGCEYPLGFTTVFVGTMDVPEFDVDTVTIAVRDRQRETAVPLQSTKYAGDNVLPDGLEGVEDLAGKPKPLLYGKVKNAPGVMVNTSKLIVQLHDGALDSVEDVYDRGISLRVAPTDWGDTSSFVNLTDTRALAWGDGLWVAGGAGGGSPRIETSPDGETWTARTPNGINGTVFGIAYSPELDIFVAVSGRLSGSEGASSSPDGVTWTARDCAVDQGLNAVAWCPDVAVFVAVGQNGALITSTNGTSWTSRTSGFGASPIWGAAEGNGTIVVAGEDGKVATSPDGTTWTLRVSQFDTTDILTATFGGGLHLIAGLEGKIAISADGIAWALQNSGIDPGATFAQLIYATYGAGWFVVSNNASLGNSALISRDAITWTAVATGASGGGYEVVYSPTLEVFGLTSGAEFRHTPNVTDYASLADLEDDSLAPAAGTYKTYLAGGYIRLGSIPAGLITADATEGGTAADRTAGQIFTRVLTKLGMTSVDWSASDVTALDSAAAYVLGYYTSEEVQGADVLDQIAASVGASWGADADGIFRIRQLTIPQGAPTRTLTRADCLVPLERIRTNDEGRGLPFYRIILQYARNYTVQTNDLAFGVDDARRAIVGKEWLTVEASDAGIQTKHPLAPQLTIETLIAETADAETEVARLLVLHGVRHDRFEAVLPYDTAASAHGLNDVLRVVDARFGLWFGPKFRVLSLAPESRHRRIRVGLWGGTDSHPRQIAATIAGDANITAAVA